MSNQDRAEGNNVPHFHGDDGSLAVNAMRTEFEHWYVTESFDYPSNPLGSRQCDLQWRAWRAARTATPQAPGADTPGGRGEAVGCLNIQRWKGIDSMVNHDFDYYGNLPDGTYQLYTHPAESSGGDAVVMEWRWLDEKGRAMTNWKQGDPPPMDTVSDEKGTMRVEVRYAVIASGAEHGR